jgi:glutaminase
MSATPDELLNPLSQPPASAPRSGSALGSASASDARSRAVIAALQQLHDRYRDLKDGRLANYIPELAKVDPDRFGISLVTVDGQAFGVGDDEHPFTIQSVSKPFVYGMALEDAGREAVLGCVGVEPSGDAYNSIIRLDIANRPHNPMVNAGAIAVTGLIRGGDPTDRLDRTLDMLGRYIGRRPAIDVPVFISERNTGHRNRAIAHLLLHFGVIENRVDEILDLYFQQCSVMVTTRDLAVMAATLANQGVNPLTGERAIDRQYIRDLLTVMLTCGMYNYAGEWAYTVGLPAKSGVAGGVIAVVPGHFGIAVYSPRVDERGNSVRGIKVCEDISRDAGLHLLETLPGPGELLARIAGLSGG